MTYTLYSIDNFIKHLKPYKYYKDFQDTPILFYHSCFYDTIRNTFYNFLTVYDTYTCSAYDIFIHCDDLNIFTQYPNKIVCITLQNISVNNIKICDHCYLVDQDDAMLLKLTL